jgi:rhodanese-related sulfurtransferase
MRIITTHQLKELLDTQDVILLDVQAEEEFIIEHIPDAFNVPLGLLDEFHDEIELPKDQRVVVYANDSVDALTAAKLLEQKGYNSVLLYEGGLTDWEEHDYAIEGLSF